MLAYTLGMRHAFDADHIAAIDNTTRKLMAEGKRPIECRILLLARSFVDRLRLGAVSEFRHPGPRQPGEGAGAPGCTSRRASWGRRFQASSCYLIAALNIVILRVDHPGLRDLRKGSYDDEELEEQLNKRGLMNRFLGGLARRIDTSWKMYPVGVLFGLGFDTATEVALLVLSGTAVASGLPFYAVLSLPLLFAAGMCLFDTFDGCFMNFAYGWAFRDRSARCTTTSSSPGSRSRSPS